VRVVNSLIPVINWTEFNMQHLFKLSQNYLRLLYKLLCNLLSGFHFVPFKIILTVAALFEHSTFGIGLYIKSTAHSAQ
jgi:hypothetical protein